MLPDYLSDADLHEIIRRALAEDVRDGDVTTLATVPDQAAAAGVFLAKESGVLAGRAVADFVFELLDSAIAVSWLVDDGDEVSDGQEVARIAGPARGILVGERTALNMLQRMSGIASLTHKMVSLASPYGTEILDTRKTAPGLRLLDKWAVRIGGGRNHRIGLFDMILIKDNHVAVAGGIREAVEAATAFLASEARQLQIEVEVRTLDELRELLEVEGADVVLLDNMARTSQDGTVDTTMLREAVGMVAGKIRTEASGNVSLETVAAIASTGVDFISSGALTHSVKALDISLKLNFQ
ncbi:MAG: carboxylating nicotinate-nucleotide diphosphorylase [Rhodothermia bacterium]|nr:carboxylating nicotinate-nucleotide diphosphorylase [Rhodothermia bacterium]